MEALKSGVGVPCGIAYTYYAARRLPRGFPRLVAVIPVVVMYIILPWQVSTLHMKGFTGFAFMWIGSFRLLMLCFDVGPLATPWAQSNLFNFMAVAVFPVKLREPNSVFSYGYCCISLCSSCKCLPWSRNRTPIQQTLSVQLLDRLLGQKMEPCCNRYSSPICVWSYSVHLLEGPQKIREEKWRTRANKSWREASCLGTSNCGVVDICSFWIDPWTPFLLHDRDKNTYLGSYSFLYLSWFVHIHWSCFQKRLLVSLHQIAKIHCDPYDFHSHIHNRVLAVLPPYL